MVTAHPVPKGTLWVKFEPRGNGICSGQVISDGQVYHCMGPTEWGSNKSRMVDTLWRIQVSGKFANYMIEMKQFGMITKKVNIYYDLYRVYIEIKI